MYHFNNINPFNPRSIIQSAVNARDEIVETVMRESGILGGNITYPPVAQAHVPSYQINPAFVNQLLGEISVTLHEMGFTQNLNEQETVNTIGETILQLLQQNLNIDPNINIGHLAAHLRDRYIAQEINRQNPPASQNNFYFPNLAHTAPPPPYTPNPAPAQPPSMPPPYFPYSASADLGTNALNLTNYFTHRNQNYVNDSIARGMSAAQLGNILFQDTRQNLGATAQSQRVNDYNNRHNNSYNPYNPYHQNGFYGPGNHYHWGPV